MKIPPTNLKPLASPIEPDTHGSPSPTPVNQGNITARQENEKPLCHQNNPASNNTQKNLLTSLTQGANKLNNVTKLAASFAALQPDNTFEETDPRKYSELSAREKVHKAADYVSKLGNVASALIPFVAVGSTATQSREIAVAGLSAVAIVGQGANALATATAPKPLRSRPTIKAKL
jgi:hypothetical protein